jgi:hypothetical protein
MARSVKPRSLFKSWSLFWPAVWGSAVLLSFCHDAPLDEHIKRDKRHRASMCEAGRADGRMVESLPVADERSFFVLSVTNTVLDLFFSFLKKTTERRTK